MPQGCALAAYSETDLTPSIKPAASSFSAASVRLSRSSSILARRVCSPLGPAWSKTSAKISSSSQPSKISSSVIISPPAFGDDCTFLGLRLDHGRGPYAITAVTIGCQKPLGSFNLRWINRYIGSEGLDQNLARQR